MTTFLLFIAILVLPALAMGQAAGTLPVWMLVSCVAVPSVVGFVLIAVDKGRARGGQRRVPESTLHLVELLGGWPGSYLAQLWCRHKTAKASYRRIFWAIVVLYQLVAIGILLGWAS
ncbi:MAG: DUF1294 domain-containing protein [Acidobacteriota bacterium]